MALNITGGTDHAWWTIVPAQANMGTVSFWMRSTQTTANTAPLSYWGATSRNGWGFILNNTANKIAFIGYGSSAQRINILSTTNINDGNPHHILACYGRFSGNSCQLWVDGVLEANANSSGSWSSAGGSFFVQAGDQVDAFWGTYVGDIWDVAHWANTSVVLDNSEIASLAQGYSPTLIRPAELQLYAPLVRDAHCLKGNALNSITGTAAADHGKRTGGAI